MNLQISNYPTSHLKSTVGGGGGGGWIYDWY